MAVQQVSALLAAIFGGAPAPVEASGMELQAGWMHVVGHCLLCSHAPGNYRATCHEQISARFTSLQSAASPSCSDLSAAQPVGSSTGLPWQFDRSQRPHSRIHHGAQDTVVRPGCCQWRCLLAVPPSCHSQPTNTGSLGQPDTAKQRLNIAPPHYLPRQLQRMIAATDCY